MSSFQERREKLFNELKDAEQQCNFSKPINTQPDLGVVDKTTYKRLKCEMKKFKGRESIFKRPEANIRECLRAKKTPDFLKNPQSWTYYSLSDVTPEQLSDTTNTATALAFIREMEEKHGICENMEQDDETVFKKPVYRVSAAVKKTSDNEPEKPIYRGRKVIMPEYVVGKSQKKEKKIKLAYKESHLAQSNEKEKKAELKLNHLYEEED